MRLAIYLLLSFNASLAIAWNPFGSKVPLYKCKNIVESRSCSNTCTKLEAIEVEFKVNVEKSLVTQVVFENGKQTGSNAFKNCKVIDAKNWECEENNESQYSSRQSNNSMSNGKYSSWAHYTNYPVPKMGLKGMYVETYGCTK